ncbi:MAG: outer membrane protein transport protein [Pseudomonadales bacterium]|nr:outer membrane protein transport protein [Pseudomonadales bacterium]
MQNVIKIALSTLAMLLTANAHAVVSESLTIGSAKALGLGHAVTADPPGIDSVHFNPAGLTRLEGRQYELKIFGGIASVEMTFDDHYTDTWTEKIEQNREGAPADYTYDEVLGQTSKLDGLAAMLPGVGLTGLPAVLAAPLGGASYSPPGSNFTFANNVYPILAGGFTRSDTDPGRFVGRQLGFSVFSYFSPSFAVKVTEDLSFGATVTFNYSAVGVDLDFREPNLLISYLEDLRAGKCNDLSNPDQFLEISDFFPCTDPDHTLKLYDVLGRVTINTEKMLSLGFNLGVLWDVTPWLSIGAVYQSPIDMDMEGDFSFEQSDSLLNFINAMDVHFGNILSNGPKNIAALTKRTVEGKARLKMEYPEHFAFGTSLQLTPSLKWNLDYKFTGWSSWKTIQFTTSEPIGVITIASFLDPDTVPAPAGQRVDFPLNFHDTWNWATGFEYQWNDRLALRLGIEDRPTSSTEGSFSPMIPIGDSRLYSVGGSYKLSSTEMIDFAFGTLTSEVRVPGNSTSLGTSEDPTDFIYNPYSGTGISTELNVNLFEFSYRTHF